MKPDIGGITLSRKELGNFLIQICSRGISFKFTARGMSMAPFICDGDAVIIAPLDKKIELGDVVAFISPEKGSLIIHRVIRKSKDRYLLKGDNVYLPDGFCKKAFIYGYIKQIIPNEKSSVTRIVFRFLSHYKAVAATLSRYRVLTPLCRIANKLL